MSGAQCWKCGRSQDAPSAQVYQCVEIDCPIRNERRIATRHIVILILVGLLVAGLAIAGIVYFVQSRPPAAADPGDVFAAPPVAVPVVRPKASVSDSGFTGPNGAAPSPVAAPPPRVADPADAASRAQYARMDPALTRPSFDCATATAPALRLICADPELSVMDRNTHILFIQQLAHSRDREGLRRRHAEWVTARTKLPPEREPLIDSYRAWAASLSAGQ